MIECNNITKVYKSGSGEVETQVLKGISFKIDSGEFVAIMGPSGSGKSTLMNIIGCLDVPSGGEFILNGKNVSDLSDDELADIRKNNLGFVFQSFNLLPRATVLHNVMMPLIYSGTPKEKREAITKKALENAGLSESHFHHYSNQLSGGQMQRVAIARALVNNPLIILADEPTGNLDTKTGEIVLATFQKLNEDQKRTVILITHERYVAEHADRIITIKDGLILSDEKNKKKREINVT